MSNMRYITVPTAITVVDFVQTPQGEVVTRGTKKYGYFDLLDEMVWNDPTWRKDELHASVYNRAYAAHKERPPVIALLETDYAVFAPLATLQGKQLGGPNVDAINKLTQAVTFASSNAPAAP